MASLGSASSSNEQSIEQSNRKKPTLTLLFSHEEAVLIGVRQTLGEMMSADLVGGKGNSRNFKLFVTLFRQQDTDQTISIKNIASKNLTLLQCASLISRYYFLAPQIPFLSCCTSDFHCLHLNLYSCQFRVKLEKWCPIYFPTQLI